MNLQNIPDVKSERYPKPVTVKVSQETHRRLTLIRQSGKDIAEFLRQVIDQKLDEVFEENAG